MIEQKIGLGELDSNCFMGLKEAKGERQTTRAGYGEQDMSVKGG
jgi:hypothetical protein